jgi:hypothetical protein
MIFVFPAILQECIPYGDDDWFSGVTGVPYGDDISGSLVPQDWIPYGD